MVTTFCCGENAMTKDGNAWSFTGEPQGEGHWWSTSTYRLRNCEYEPLTLEQECDSCPVLSAFGEMAKDRNAGAAVHGQRTVVWSLAGSVKKSCEWESVDRRTGSLFNDSGTFRLQDTELQLEFILGRLKDNCDPKLSQLYTVVGEPRLALRVVDSAASGTAPRESDKFNKLGLSVQETITEHLQFLNSKWTDEENVVVSQVNRIDCRLDRLKVFELLTLSKFSGIQAARALNLMDCQSLEGFGRQAVIRQREQATVEFTVETTACGAQPRAGNFTIDRDGFTLRPFQPCLWKSSLVNFNGDAYVARDGDWVMEKVTRVVKHGVLLSQFKHDVDMSASLLSSAMEREHTYSYHLLSELAGALDQHGSVELGTVVQAAAESVNKVPELLYWWKVFKTILYSALCLVGLALCVYLVFYFRKPLWLHFGGCIRRLRNRVSKRDTVVFSASAGQSVGGSAPEETELLRLYPDRAVFMKRPTNADDVPTVPL